MEYSFQNSNVSLDVEWVASETHYVMVDITCKYTLDRLAIQRDGYY